jgi:hypothetical protein
VVIEASAFAGDPDALTTSVAFRLA